MSPHLDASVSLLRGLSKLISYQVKICPLLLDLGNMDVSKRFRQTFYYYYHKSEV